MLKFCAGVILLDAFRLKASQNSVPFAPIDIDYIAMRTTGIQNSSPAARFCNMTQNL